MLFQKRIDRAFAYQKEKAKKESSSPSGEYDPQKDREEPALNDIMEKSDMPALILSALLTILPICLIVLLVMVGVGWLFFCL